MVKRLVCLLLLGGALADMDAVTNAGRTAASEEQRGSTDGHFGSVQLRPIDLLRHVPFPVLHVVQWLNGPMQGQVDGKAKAPLSDSRTYTRDFLRWLVIACWRFQCLAQMDMLDCCKNASY